MKKNIFLELNFFCLLCLLLFTTVVSSQVVQKDWTKQKKDNLSRSYKETILTEFPNKYSIWTISVDNFSRKLAKGGTSEQEIAIPAPNGKFDNYIIKPSKIVADEVAHLYTVKTFMGYKKGNPSILISCDISNAGFHASVYENGNTFFMEPLYKKSSKKVIAYYKRDNVTEKLHCNVMSRKIKTTAVEKLTTEETITKRTYRLAITTTGEYSRHFGGNPVNKTDVLNAVASGVNMLAPIYLRDLGVSFSLVTTEDLIYTDPNTDPFGKKKNNRKASHDSCVKALTLSGFDIGHMVNWANTGGSAHVGVICSSTQKGKGYSGINRSLTTLWVDYVAHELGHQFGSEHNFVSKECRASVSGYRYEPGEGSSIMSYANVCGRSVQYARQSDPFFHYASIKQMMDIMNKTTCAKVNDLGNSASPIVNANADIIIPKDTPFVLVGKGTDENDNDENLSYNWIQYDGGSDPVSGSPNCTSTNVPLFRYRPAVSESFRSFPTYNDILQGNNDQKWEKLPCAVREMNFLLVVRDNNSNYGRIGKDKTLVTVADTGPFNVTSPNGEEEYDGNTNQTITWSVNGTNTHCEKVDILLSSDGGITYTVVADGTENDGSENVLLPNESSSKMRVLVRCDVLGGFRAASTFYDVSNSNFTIRATESFLSVNTFDSLGVKIYPNPAKDIISFNLKKQENYSFIIFDIRGRVVLERKLKVSSEFKINHLKTGVYFLELLQEKTNKRAIKKIIIQH